MAMSATITLYLYDKMIVEKFKSAPYYNNFLAFRP